MKVFKTEKLSSLCNTIADCPHSTPLWTSEGKIVIRNSNIKNGRLDLTEPSYTDIEHFNQRIRREKPVPGDLIITREAPMGEVCIIPDNVECCLGQRMVLLKPDKEKCNNVFLLYSMLSKFVQSQIAWSEGTGTTVSNLRIPFLEKLEIPAPPLPEQRAIAATLSALDDKIELNNRINKTLEEMAQALFKRWFVDFEFPDENGQPYKSSGGEMEESELGLIPKGWKVAQLSEAVTLVNKTIDPQKHRDILFEHFSIPCFDDKKTPVFELGENIKSNKFVINSANILVSKLNPSTKRIWKPLCSTANAVCSTEFMVYKAMIEKNTDYYYSLMDSVEFQNFILAHVTGSTNSRQRVTPSSTLQFKYVAPSDPILEMYAEIAKSIFAKVQINTIENCRLIKARDALLPKLMSGEIRVPIEEVAADV